MTPERIADRYRVERAAGRGGMGTVWLCADEKLGRQVALKQVGTLPGESSTDLARAMREARSTAALNHRNVVAVYDAVDEGDHIWLVMEYVPGRTLAEILASEGPLSPERAVHIGAQVADGLAAAHDRGMVHRDVKPGNILVTGDDVAKISDFGIARTHGDTQLTQSGMVTGTPAYFAPELARGDDPTGAADVWALGATLYSAVEGQTPYPEQPNALALLSQIASTPPPRPQRAGFLTEPIVRMLDPDPRSRWSMDDVAHVLHQLERQHATSDTRSMTAESPAPVAVGAAVGADTQAADNEDDVPAPPPSGLHDEGDSRRRGGGLTVVGLVATLVLAAVVGYLLLRGPDAEPAADDAPSSEGSASPPAEEDSPTSEDTSESSPSASPTESDSPVTSATPGESPASASEAEQFVTDYYAVLPDDPKTGWSSLSPGFQDEIGSYGDYRGFWRTLSDVEVTDTSPAGDGAVDVSLTYTDDDGGSESEVRRLYVDQSEDGFLITGDEIVG